MHQYISAHLWSLTEPDALAEAAAEADDAVDAAAEAAELAPAAEAPAAAEAVATATAEATADDAAAAEEPAHSTACVPAGKQSQDMLRAAITTTTDCVSTNSLQSTTSDCQGPVAYLHERCVSQVVQQATKKPDAHFSSWWTNRYAGCLAVACCACSGS